jgi:hypothetical protein
MPTIRDARKTQFRVATTGAGDIRIWLIWDLIKPLEGSFEPHLDPDIATDELRFDGVQSRIDRSRFGIQGVSGFEESRQLGG